MTAQRPSRSDDRAALRAACEPGTGLCTIVGIEGSFSRRLGAQLAVHPDGGITGSLADGCLEKQLASEIERARGQGAVVKRFGAGSPIIDFRLPCGSGLDILIDPQPDHRACRQAVNHLDLRRPATLDLDAGQGLLRERRYIPPMRLALFGEGPELEELAQLAGAAGIEVSARRKDDPSALSLGKAPQGEEIDEWTAVILLFHDHEWEQALLQWALQTPAFHIGAQGGAEARNNRMNGLRAAGVAEDQLQRISSPIGLIPRSREPSVLALSVLAQVVGEYEALHPHG
ncbi:xanthine dehydrogenase accessory factor [Altererythrobacter atlanticus]|nr:XdhC family protein [Croceibacterium atlanticum]MBB5732522.1 xanthine dehydrogenase accessory factor [Croceibacterium atlanticum]